MKKFIALALIAVLLVIGLAACGGGNTPGAGKYEGDYGKWVGDSDEDKIPASEDPFSLELNGGGKGKFNRDDVTFDVTWKLDGENFTMTETFLGLTNEYTGTLKDGKLVIYNGDPDDDFTYMYVFK